MAGAEGAGPTGGWLVVGLGNPGPEYDQTRHNAGFAAVALLARRHGAPLRRAGNGELARTRLGPDEVLLLRPLTYMNVSGEAVGPVARRHAIEPAHVLVVHDDMDLAAGRLRLRPGGGSGGHRGVASIVAKLGTDAVPRVRVGIGRPPAGQDAVEFVLGAVGPDERPSWEAAITRAADAVEVVCRVGLEAAMARFNRSDPV